MFLCSHAQKQTTQPDYKLWDKPALFFTHLFNTNSNSNSIELTLSFFSFSPFALSHQSKNLINFPSSIHSHLPLQHLSYLNHGTTTQPFSLSPNFAHCNPTLPPWNLKSPSYVKSQLYGGFTDEANFVQTFKHIER